MEMLQLAKVELPPMNQTTPTVKEVCMLTAVSHGNVAVGYGRIATNESDNTYCKRGVYVDSRFSWKCCSWLR